MWCRCHSPDWRLLSCSSTATHKVIGIWTVPGYTVSDIHRTRGQTGDLHHRSCASQRMSFDEANGTGWTVTASQVEAPGSRAVSLGSNGIDCISGHAAYQKGCHWERQRQIERNRIG